MNDDRTIRLLRAIVVFAASVVPVIAPAKELQPATAVSAIPQLHDTESVPAGSGHLEDLWNTGRLPAPAAVSSADPDAAAVQLAAAVARRDGNSLAALLAALSASGISIQRTDGNDILEATDRNHAIIMPEWQVAAMAKQYAGGVALPLLTASQTVQEAFPGTQAEEIGRLILRDINKATNNRNASVRFWARFIVELGRYPPHDVEHSSAPKSDSDTPRVQLDAIQFNLVITRVAADLVVSDRRRNSWNAHPYGPGRSADVGTAVVQRSAFDESGIRHELNRRWPLEFTRIASSILDFIAPAASATSLSGGPPCQFGEAGSMILDWYGAVTGTAFDELIEYLGAKAAQSFIGGLRLMLKALEFSEALTAFKMEIVIDKEPLVRTKSTSEDGEKPARILTPSARLDTSSAQWRNCIRPALLLAGLDYEAEKPGDLLDNRVDWEVVEGEDLFLIIPSVTGQETSLPIDHPVAALGRRQKCPVIEPAEAVQKRGAVKATVHVFTVENVAQLTDEMGAGLGVSFIVSLIHGLDPLGAMANLIGSLKYIEHFFTQTKEFPITDWKSSQKLTLTLREESAFQLCRGAGCVDRTEIGEVEIPLKWSDDNCSFMGRGVMKTTASTKVHAGGYLGATGQAEDGWVVSLEGKMVGDDVARMQIQMSDTGGDQTATVYDPRTGRPITSSSEALDVLGLRKCNSEMCTGFEMAFRDGEIKEISIPNQLGTDKVSIILRSR